MTRSVRLVQEANAFYVMKLWALVTRFAIWIKIDTIMYAFLKHKHIEQTEKNVQLMSMNTIQNSLFVKNKMMSESL